MSSLHVRPFVFFAIGMIACSSAKAPAARGPYDGQCAVRECDAYLNAFHAELEARGEPLGGTIASVIDDDPSLCGCRHHLEPDCVPNDDDERATCTSRIEKLHPVR